MNEARQRAEAMLAICEAADDQDTGSFDVFREEATVGAVAILARDVLAAERELAKRNASFDALSKNADKVLAQVGVLRLALHDIHIQATRKERASGLKRYLETDLEIIAQKSEGI